MAGGNLGDLWFQLGVKDNTSKELQKIIDKLKTGDDAANALLRALQGFGTKKSGFKEQAEKAKEFADVLNEINRRISKLKKNDKSNEAKDLQMAVKNALSYLDMLQRINIERSKISELRSLNPNVDTSKLREAELMLENINNQLFRLQNKAQGGGGGGVDYANVLQDYAKVLQMTFRDVKQITDQFKKEAFSGGAAKVEADISRVTEKLAKMRDLMAEGALKGYNTNMLGGSITELDKILARLQAASGNKSILTDAAQMKNLLSDVAVEMVKATSATQAYGREKGKVIAQEREYNRFLNESRKSTNDASIAYDRLSRSLKELAVLNGKGLSVLGVDGTTNIKKSISELLSYQSILEQIKNNGGFHPITGKTARDITSSSEYKKAIDDAKEYAKEVKNSIKEVEKAREDAKKKADAAIENQKKLDNGETAYYAKVRDILQQIDTLSKGMTPFLNATANKNMVFPSHLVDDLKKLHSVQQTLLANNHAGRNMGLDWLKDFQNRNGFSVITKELRDFMANAEEARKRYVRLFDVLNELRNTRAAANIAGVDTSKIDSQIESTLAALKELRTIMQTGIGDAKGVLGSDSRSVTLAGRVNKEVREGIRLEQKRQQEIAQTGARIQSDLVRGFEKANSHAGKLNSTIQDLKSLFLQGGLLFGAQQFAMSIITTGGEIEKQHIALQSILGDVQNANTMFNQTKELALNSPFTFSELNRDVKQLAAYGVEYDQLYDTTKRLADMSSGLGVSFDRIALAFGQVQARGWLDGKELRQIAYAGIPLLDKLSKYYSEQEGRKVSTSEIKTRISSREVSFDDVKNIFWQMTDAGGQFYNMQQTLSETLLGRYNKLKDAWEIMLSEFASGNSVVGGFFKTALDGATALVQALHTLAPVVTAAFSGYALTKLSRMMGGNAGSAYLSTKGKLAVDASAKIAEGKQLNSVERNILATKNRITGVDLRNLIANKAINKTDLQRLLVTGKISTKQYQVYAALLRQQGATDALNTKTFTYGLSWTHVGVAAKLALNGIATAASSMWAAIGGLPGLIVTGVTMLVAKLWGDYAELTNAIKQTNDELVDRQKQMNEFRSRNDAKSIISRGDSKEIDNAINDYEEKLKELSPYEADLFIMSANERKSHEDRLKYLEEQLKLMQEANNVVQSKLANRDNYSDLQDLFDSARRKVEQYSQAKDKLISFVPDKTESDENNFLDKKNLERWVNNSMQQLDSASRKISEKISEMYKGIKAPKAEIESMQKQTIDSFVSGLSIPEEQMKDLRLSIYKNLGLLNGALKVELGQKLAKSVADSMPEAANAIRSGRELDEASKNKVKEIAKGCIEQMKAEYPRFANELQGMLNASNFQAVIRLIYTSDSFPKFTEAEQSLYDQYIPAPQRTGSSKKDKKFSAFIKSLGGSGKNSTGKDLNDAAYQKLQKLWETAEAAKVGKYDKAYKDKTMKAYLDQKALTEEILGIKFVPTYNKSNKPYKPGKSGGSKEDEQLKDLRTRISLYKKMYAEIKNYKELFGEGALGQLANDGEFESIFKNKKGFPISDYTNYETSIKQILGTLPSSTKDRKDFKDSEIASIQSENRKLLEDQRRDELNTLNKQLDVISEQYETYKKIYELTGNKNGSENIAFGGTVQFDTYKRFLEEQLDVAVKHDNIQSGLNLTTDEVKGMSLENVKDRYGEESRVYDIRKKLEDENNKIKKETIDLMANLIEKNATISQQIEDENRKYERQLELIKGIKDPKMRERAQAGAAKVHNENVAKLQFEQFKQESDWVTIFDDLDRVSSATINTMINNIDEFSRTTGLSVEVVKQLRDALDKLRDEQIDRNPLPSIFGGVRRGNAIGEILRSNRKVGASGINISDAQAKKTGLVSGKWYSNADLENSKKGAYNDSSKAITSLSGKMQALSNIMDPVINLFEALGEQDSILGQIAGGASGALSSAASTAGAIGTLSKMKGFEFLEGAGPYGAAAAAALSVGSSLIKAFGADYSSYNKAKAEYDNLSSIWDSLISKKTEYMNIHWGTEATEASKEAQEMLKAEIEQTKVIAQKRLNSGSSAGSHSIWYRMWKGSYGYNGQNWRDVAGEISSKYGVQFNGMEDMLNMNADTLSKIKKDYTGLWANMDSDFRDYLEKLIQYGEKADDMIEAVTEKLTGNKFSDLVSSWGDAMSTMANSSDNLVDHFEDNLKKTILNSMIEDLYGDKIKAILAKAKKYGDSKESADWIVDGKYMGPYTPEENAEIKSDVENVSKQIEATRDFFKKSYGWSDNSSSSSRNSVKGITEETADILVSYCNSMRADLAMVRESQAKFIPEMNEIAKSQLTQLNAIARNTLRNADAAERIESIFVEYNDNFNRVLNGTKSLKMK
jgi:hypothetical protein